MDENLAAGAYTNSSKAETRAAHDRVMGLFPILKDRRKQVAGYLSGGEQQMLAITTPPDVDAEAAGARRAVDCSAPLLVQQIKEIIVDINKQGTSVSCSSSRTRSWPSRSPCTAT